MHGPDESPGADDDELDLLEMLEAEFGDEGDDQPDAESPPREESMEAPAKRQRLDTGSGTQSCPPHPGFMGGICIRCGAIKEGFSSGVPEESAEGSDNVALRYIHRGLEISRSEAERMRQGTASRVLSGRKLLLMLDLDHTLLNSSRFGEVDTQGEAVLRALMERQPADAPHIYCLPHMRMWTKLRPGVREFLQRAHDLFELHIYTMGDREYAAEMARLLDPGGRLFHGRVISSGDTTQRQVKDLDIVLGNENVVLILDDTEGVWPRHRGNLVQIERYTYFPADARRFGLGCQSLLERRMDEDGERGALSVSLQVMEQVHSRYFAEDPEGGHSDVRRHLFSIRRAILEGVTVLFSRVIPLDCAEPHMHPLWRLAVDLGAECTTQTCDSVTHVVATDNTDKTRWAKRHGKRVVNPNWLWCSAFTWARADEARFPVTAASSAAAQSALQRTPEDDLAAALAAAGGGTGELVTGGGPSGEPGTGQAAAQPSEGTAGNASTDEAAAVAAAGDGAAGGAAAAAAGEAGSGGGDTGQGEPVKIAVVDAAGVAEACPPASGSPEQAAGDGGGGQPAGQPQENS